MPGMAITLCPLGSATNTKPHSSHRGDATDTVRYLRDISHPETVTPADSTRLLQTFDKVREATTSDPTMFRLLETIEDGMPDTKLQLSPYLREYFNFREHLSTTDGVVLYKDRVLIPPVLREDILKALHAAHQGVTSMTARANVSIFWPGITTDIARLRNSCMDCNRISPSQPNAPPTTPVDPEFPFQCICADYFTYKGAHYLIIVDRYSNWPIIKKTSGGAAGLVKSLWEEFITYGIAEELASDGGPEFVATETQEFLKSTPPIISGVPAFQLQG